MSPKTCSKKFVSRLTSLTNDNDTADIMFYALKNVKLQFTVGSR